MGIEDDDVGAVARRPEYKDAFKFPAELSSLRLSATSLLSMTSSLLSSIFPKFTLLEDAPLNPQSSEDTKTFPWMW
jgi:hypothetical protein